MNQTVRQDALQRALVDLCEWASAETQLRLAQRVRDLDNEILTRTSQVDAARGAIDDALAALDVARELGDSALAFVLGERVRDLEEQAEKINPMGLVVKRQKAEQDLRRLKFAADVISKLR